MLKRLISVFVLSLVVGCGASVPRQLSVSAGIYEPVQIAAEACVYDISCYKTDERKKMIQRTTRSITNAINEARNVVNACTVAGCDDVTEQFALISSGLRSMRVLVLDHYYGPVESKAIIDRALTRLEEDL